MHQLVTGINATAPVLIAPNDKLLQALTDIKQNTAADVSVWCGPFFFPRCTFVAR
jgi:hypothetical protein